MNSIMITILVKDCNYISKELYESVINSLQLHQLECSCGHCGCLTIHGYYYRSVKNPEGTIRLRIQRVICSECGVTHSLHLSLVVPYSRIPAADQQQIVLFYDQGKDPRDAVPESPDIDENNIKSVLRAYRRHWRERLRSEGIRLAPVGELIQQCFSFYSMQFMQIRRTFNKLFPGTT